MVATHEVFPTRVGVDRFGIFARLAFSRFPHTRGGGPPSCITQKSCDAFSPHAWGWTVVPPLLQPEPVVFPTRVGVDLGIRRLRVYLPSFPHTRGGGPRHTENTTAALEFSPHAWGWTDLLTVSNSLPNVFPTRVGVDLSLGTIWFAVQRFPHTRGGGPVTAC